MADTKADGSINIDSRVDTSGFQKGAKEIEKGTEDLVKKVNAAGDGLQSVGNVDTKQTQQALDGITQKAQEAGKAASDMHERLAENQNLLDIIKKFNAANDAVTTKDTYNPQKMSYDRMRDRDPRTLESQIEGSKAAVAQMQEAVQEFQQAANPENAEHENQFTSMVETLNFLTGKVKEAEIVVANFKAATEQKKIEVPTTVDEEGFKKGSSRMQTAIASMQEKFNGLEAKIRGAFDGIFAQPEKDAKGMVKTADDLEKSCDELDAKFAEIGKTPVLSDAIKKLEALRYEINNMGRQTYDIDGEKLLGFDTAGFDEMAEKYRKLEDQVISAAKTAGSMMAGQTKAERQAIDRFNDTASLIDGEGDLEEQKDLMADLCLQAETFAQSFSNADAIDEMKAKIVELSQVMAAAEKEAKKAEGAPKEPQKTPYVGAYDDTTKQIKAAPRATELAKDALKNALAGIASMAGTAMAEVQSVIQSPADVVNRALGAMALKAKDTASGLAALAKGAIAAGLNGVAQAAKGAAKGLANMAKNAVTGAFDKLKNSISGLNKGLKGNHTSLKGGFKTVLKYAFGIRSLYILFNKLRSAVKEGLGNVMKYDPALKATVNDFKLSITTLKNAVGAAIAPIAQIVLPVITRIIDAITEAVNRFGELAAALTGQTQYTKATKAQAAAYQEEEKAAKKAQKTIAGFDDMTILDEKEDEDAPKNVGFETAPIEAGISSLADALKNMWQQADFTNLGRLLGERLRDALNSIPWDEIKAMCARIGKSIATFLNGFFETPGLFTAIGRTIAQALNSVFEFLNAFVSNLHWASIGLAIKDGILGFLDNIDWALIQDTFFKLGQGIASLIGAVFSDPTLPIKIGQAIANAINTAFLGLYGFVTTLPWGDIGTGIKNGILGFLNGIDWNLIFNTMARAGKGIGEAFENAVDDPNLWTAIFTTFSKKVKALFIAIYNFITTPDWKSIGASIGKGLNAGVEEFPWELVTATLIKAVNSLFDLLINFLANFDFRAFGEHVGSLISDSIMGIDWARGAAAIGLALTGLLDFFNGLMSEMDWKGIGGKVIDAVAGFFSTFRWESVGEFISNVVTGLFDFLYGMFEKVDWEKLPGQMLSAVVRFLQGINWPKVLASTFRLLATAWTAGAKVLAGVGGVIFKAGGFIISGLFNGIKAIITGAPKWLKDNVFTPIWNGIKSAFGISSPAKEMEPLGGWITEGLFGGILGPLKGVFGWIQEHISNPIIGGVKKLFGIDSGKTALEDSGSILTEGLKKGAAGVMSTIGGWIKGTVTDPITNGVSTNLGTNSIPATVADGAAVVKGLQDGMTKEAGGLEKTVGSEVADPLLSGITDPLGMSNGSSSVFSGFGSASMTSLKAGMETNAQMVSAYAKQMATGLKDAYEAVDWASIGGYMMHGLYDGLLDNWDWIYTYVTNFAGSLFDAVKGVFGIASPSKEFYWIAEMLTAGLVGGVKDTSKDAVGAVEGVANAITEEAEQAHPVVSMDTALAGTMNQLDATMATFADRVVGGFEAMVASLQSIAASAGIILPQTAMGAMAPYATRISTAASNAGPTMETIMELIAAQNADKLTREDLQEVLIEVAREYFNVELYLGDEQVARSANRGNVRLNRRFSPVGK